MSDFMVALEAQRARHGVDHVEKFQGYTYPPEETRGLILEGEEMVPMKKPKRSHRPSYHMLLKRLFVDSYVQLANKALHSIDTVQVHPTTKHVAYCALEMGAPQQQVQLVHHQYLKCPAVYGWATTPRPTLLAHDGQQRLSLSTLHEEAWRTRFIKTSKKNASKSVGGYGEEAVEWIVMGKEWRRVGDHKWGRFKGMSSSVQSQCCVGEGQFVMG